VSGFVLKGFFLRKKARHRLQELKEEERTLIFYESPFRLVKTLEQFSEIFGSGRQASVSRELTKMFEETKRGTLREVCDYFKAKTVKGEVVIVVAGNHARNQ